MTKKEDFKKLDEQRWQRFALDKDGYKSCPMLRFGSVPRCGLHECADCSPKNCPFYHWRDYR